MENGDIYTIKNKINGSSHAEGEIKYANKNVYNGIWKDFLPHGPGKLTYYNGDYFNGEFKSGLFNGYGEFIDKNNNKSLGIWKDNI